MLPQRLLDAIWLYQQAEWEYAQTYHLLKNHYSKKRVRRQRDAARDHLAAVAVDVAREYNERRAA